VLALAFCGLTGFATAMLWPGTLVFAAEYFPKAGAWLFAYLAIAGDLGGVFGPWLTGTLADKSGLKAGMLVSAIFPILSAACILIYLRKCRKDKQLRKL
jgi:MFS family permease